LRQTVERHKTTVVIALHQMHLAMRMADYVIALAAGRVVVQAPTSEVMPADLDRIFRAEISRVGGSDVEAIETGRCQ
jgi:ABC-type phosphate/phosphonate transport system ATPase subunit